MASRGGKRTSSKRQPSSRSRSTRKSTNTSRRFKLDIRPEHQRELFALGLITIAVVTLIFFATGVAGGIGAFYVEGVRRAFGSGGLVVPITLGLLGVAILIQERMQDARLSGSNVLGILFILCSILALLEFPLHTILPADRVGEGGGLLGYGIVELLDQAIGRPAAIAVVLVLGIAGVLLTFNITLRELVLDGIARTQAFWQILWSAPRRPRRAARTRADADLPFEPPPQGSSDSLVRTPIAARPTRASLFQRPDRQPAAESTPEAKSKKPDKAAATDTGTAKLNENPPPPINREKTAELAVPVKPTEPPQEIVQESLDGFEVSSVYRAWPLPKLDLLDQSSSDGRMTDDEIVHVSRLIEDTLASFKVEARVVGVNTGPAITQFELQPAVGVKVSKITTLERDLALSLAAPSIRIEAPIPGKAVVGIEIPNSSISVVGLREVLDSEDFEQSRGKLKLPLGKDVSGTPFVADMTKMPHLLVAGATGSGKSVAINAFICGLLLRHTPDELKLILVDPKMVEMSVYNRVPHLLSPVVTELERVVPTLKWATREMERRYKIFARHACRNIDSYKQMARRRNDLESMPYILIVIDELADLMMMAPDEIETYVCRLAQMARATGIHLIIATQRPSVDVITGLIKANFPSRIAFAVTSQVDSRVILDVPGADQLLGRGDMLYMAADAAKLVRIQGTFVADSEVERIVDFWRNATPPDTPADGPSGNSQAQPDAAAKPAQSSAQAATQQQPADASDASAARIEAFKPPAEFLSDNEQDELLPQATALVKQHQRASASLLVRRLRIGYSKAAQLIDLLEEQGVVGPAEGGRSREVLQHEQRP